MGHRGTFQNGNQAARQPRLSPAEQAGFCQQIRDLLARLRWDEADLDNHLGYRSAGRWTRLILRGHPPSRFYRQRFEALVEAVQAGQVSPKPGWAPLVIYSPTSAPKDVVVPLSRVAGAPRQCVECVAEMTEGHRQEADTWWWFSHPATRVCCEHRAAWRRRRNWFHRCRDLGCPHVEDLGQGAHTCRQAVCSLRRWPWTRTWERR